MVTTYTTNTLLEFLAITPGGGGGGGTGSGGGTWATQTADTMGIFIAVLLAVAIFAFIALRARQKMMAYAGNESSGSSKRFTKAYWGIGIIAALLFVIGGLSLTYSQVVANPVSNDGVSSPEKIQAHVDETTGATTFDVSYLKNGSSDPATVLGLEVTLAEGVDDGGCTWTVQGFGGKTLYENVAGQEASAFSYDLAAGATETITVATSDMTADVAKSLIGKGVLNLKFTYAITPAPITYNISFEVNDPAAGSVTPSDAFTVNSGASYKYSDSDNSLTFTDGTTSKKIEVNEATGYKFTKWTINDNPIESTASVVITESSVFKAFFDASKEVKVNGVAKDADGLPMANAVVNIYDENGDLVTTGKTDSNGNYSLTIPDKFLDIDTAIIKVHNGNNISQDIVIDKPGEQTSPITVDETAVVETGVNISGVFRDDKGQPVAGAKVTFTSTYTDNNGNIITETFSGFTLDDGKYSIQVKANKDYSGTLDKNESPEIHTTIPKRIPALEEDITLPEIKPTSTTSTVTFDPGEGSIKSVPEGWVQKNGNTYIKDYSNGSYLPAVSIEWITSGIIPPENKFFIGFDSNPKGPLITENTTLTVLYSTNVYIDGQVFDANGNPVAGADVHFVSDDGSVTKSTQTQSQGHYTFEDVPVNTPGIIQIKKENFVSSQYKIGAGGGVFNIPSLYLEEGVQLRGTVSYESGPLKNTEVLITTYIERNEGMVEEKYYKKTNEEGVFGSVVQKNHNYTISVAIPGTTPPVYVTQEQEVAETPVSIKLDVPTATNTALVTIDLNGGSVNKGASGWTKVKAGTYTRTFALGSSYEAITSEWNAISIKAPSEGKEFGGWEPSTGQLSGATSFKAKWIEGEPATPKAVYTANNKTFTFYYDNKDHSQDFTNEEDVQYDLTKDTKVDFGDLSHCVYAPWHDIDPQSKVIPIPQVQPAHVVFDSSFAAFKAYPESKENEAKPFTSMSGWFMNMYMIQDVTGFENIYDGITDFSLTFCIFTSPNNDDISDDNSNAERVLDLSQFKQPNLTNVIGTFSNSFFSKIVIPAGFAPKSTSFGKSYFLPGLGKIYMSLFLGCQASKIEILGNIGNGVKDFTALYRGCSNIKTVSDAGIDNVDLSQAEIIDHLFAMSEFEKITMPDSLKKSKSITSMDEMFWGAKASVINLAGLNTSKVTNMHNMFRDCTNLNTVDLSTVDTSSATDVTNMFNGCISLASLDMSKMNFSSTTSLMGMFKDCSALASIDMSMLDLSSITDTYSMFCNDTAKSSLISVKFPNDPSKTFQKLEVADYMFCSCKSLKTIASVDWKFASGATSQYMFDEDTSLIGGNNTKFDGIHVDGEYARVDTANTPGYFTDNSKNAVLVANSLINQDENANVSEEQTPEVNDYSVVDLVLDDSLVEDEVIIEPIEAIDGNIVEIFQTPFDALFKWFRVVLQIN